MPDKPHIATDRLRLFMEDLAAVMVTHGLVINTIIDDTGHFGNDFATFQVSTIESHTYEVPDGIVVWNDGTLAVQDVEDCGPDVHVSVRFPETAHGRLKAAARAPTRTTFSWTAPTWVLRFWKPSFLTSPSSLAPTWVLTPWLSLFP